MLGAQSWDTLVIVASEKLPDNKDMDRIAARINASASISILYLRRFICCFRALHLILAVPSFGCEPVWVNFD